MTLSKGCNGDPEIGYKKVTFGSFGGGLPSHVTHISSSDDFFSIQVDEVWRSQTLPETNGQLDPENRRNHQKDKKGSSSKHPFSAKMFVSRP